MNQIPPIHKLILMSPDHPGRTATSEGLSRDYYLREMKEMDGSTSKSSINAGPMVSWIKSGQILAIFVPFTALIFRGSYQVSFIKKPPYYLNQKPRTY